MLFGFSYKRRRNKINKAIADMTEVEREKKYKNENNKNVKDNKLKTKEKKIIIACSSILSVAVVGIIVVGLFANHYLGMINYGDVTGVVSDDLDKEEDIDFDIAEYEEITEANDNTQKANNMDNKAKVTADSKKGTTKGTTKKEDYYNLNVGKKIQEKANAEIKKNIEDDSGIWQSKDVYNLLIAGYDAGDDEKVMFEGATLPRADAVIVVSINNVKKTVKLVSLSRATYVAIPNHGNKRLNTAHAYGGASTLVDTIELNYKIKIDRYATVNFQGFKRIVDVLEGVSVDLSKTEAAFAFNDESKTAGTYTLNGNQALRYVRLRKTDSDRTRTGRQRKVIKSLTNKAKKMTLTQELDAMEKILPLINTNFTKTELVKKVGELNTYLSWTMTQDIIPHNATKLTMRDGKEVLIINWDETTDYLHSTLYSGVNVNKIKE